MSHICFIQIPEKAFMKHKNWMYHRVSPIETSCEKYNHAIDDEDIKKCGSSLFWFGWFRFFCCQKIFSFADVISEGTRYKKHRCQAPMLLSAILNHH